LFSRPVPAAVLLDEVRPRVPAAPVDA